MGQNNTINNKDVNIYITDADTDGTSLTDSDKIMGVISEYDTPAFGEKSFENIQVFGGQLLGESSSSLIDISFEFTPNGEKELDLLQHALNEDTGVYRSNERSGPKTIVLEINNEGVPLYTYGYNNARAVSFEPSHSADGNREGTISFTLTEEDEEGNANGIVVSGGVGDLPSWTTT